MSYVKMNEKRIDLVKAVREEFGKDRVTVTRRELQSIVDVEPRVHSWPTWLVNKDVLKIERGLYHLPDNMVCTMAWRLSQTLRRLSQVHRRLSQTPRRLPL